MKHKIFTTIAILLIYATGAFAQNTSKDGYQSYFGQDSTTFTILYVPCEWDDGALVIAGKIYSRDTIRINGNLYYFREPQQSNPVSNPQVMFDIPRQDTLFLREETETGRLYRYYRDYFGMGEKEKLICDMSLDIGDTIVLPGWHCLDEKNYVVNNVTYDNGKKNIYLNGIVFQNYFIEGQFPRLFPLWQEPLPEIGGDYYDLQSSALSTLLCEFKDDVHIFEHPDGCYGYNIYQVTESEEESLSVHPSIVKHNETITVKAYSYIQNVRIFDMTGRELSLSVIENSDKLWKIKISQFSGCSMCFMIIKTEQGYVYKKIVVID